MGEYILRPNADDKTAWTETPVGPGFSLVNEVVTEVDTPDTTDNFIEAPTTDAQINRQHVETFALPPGEYVAMVEGWWYIRTATTGQSVSLSAFNIVPAAQATPLVVPANTNYGWQTLRYENPTTILGLQSQIDSYELGATTSGVATVGTARIAAEFMRVITRSTWTPHRMPQGV